MKRYTFKIDHADGARTVYTIAASPREAEAQLLLEQEKEHRAVIVYADGKLVENGQFVEDVR